MGTQNFHRKNMISLIDFIESLDTICPPWRLRLIDVGHELNQVCYDHVRGDAFTAVIILSQSEGSGITREQSGLKS